MQGQRWICSECGDDDFADETALVEHYDSIHRPHRNTTYAFVATSLPAETVCPFCGEHFLQTRANVKSHIAPNMDEIALKALPLSFEDSDINESESEGENDSKNTISSSTFQEQKTLAEHWHASPYEEAGEHNSVESSVPRPSPDPTVERFSPKQGRAGTVQYPPGLGYNQLSHALSFGDYNTPLSAKNQKEGSLLLTARSPAYSKSGFSETTQVPAFLNVERPNNNGNSEVEVGSFAYMDREIERTKENPEVETGSSAYMFPEGPQSPSYSINVCDVCHKHTPQHLRRRTYAAHISCCRACGAPVDVPEPNTDHQSVAGKRTKTSTGRNKGHGPPILKSLQHIIPTSLFSEDRLLSSEGFWSIPPDDDFFDWNSIDDRDTNSAEPLAEGSLGATDDEIVPEDSRSTTSAQNHPPELNVKNTFNIFGDMSGLDKKVPILGD
ncbi:hypothetical protein BJ508DRAFT_53294 [Ascobolus immersus RN42]|uniref:Uncharacterized protein n=1 Tax=Ascobolus immersus RN42 TaxID=1160509 RepID=A0A3N4HN76_ASCIM|nr:hypothetical protein BJ508DRAFT_53294 [Ascobolus immersus RN42]